MSEILSSAWVSQWLETIAQDRELSHIGKLSRFALKLNVGGTTACFKFVQGQFEFFEGVLAPDLDVVEFVGSHPAWEKMLKVVPDPLYSDFLAMEKSQEDFSIPSERLYLLRHLRVLQRLLTIAPRRG
ncbi:hypothetical protein DMX11_08180 [Pseudomonas sp. LB-090624]|uniref:hypothetical protein n=1 Tax=Pseudomonas sp. LB-090624 TaxID=2213079 RepID=UPI000D8B153C|nr:hypothetical protein [Pseudomonas sp. LB-090624]PYB78906.1 hypothetical protein DMX11_08180 [Pseudomonas sp. LB-090624]